jgi:hypothetical protein
MKFIETFEDFLNEAKVVVKRKYTDNHPEKSISNNAPIRERILSFVNEKGSVTRQELLEFLKAMNEETGGSTSRKWISKNPTLFMVKEKAGVKTYTLSSYGKKIHESIMKQKTV